jgi:hypothetical protein
MMSGFGTQYYFSERLVNFTKVAKRSGVNVATPFVFDRSLTAGELIKTVLTDKTVLATNTDFSVRDTLSDLIANSDLSKVKM